MLRPKSFSKVRYAPKCSRSVSQSVPSRSNSSAPGGRGLIGGLAAGYWHGGARYLTNAPVLVKEPRRVLRNAASGGAEDGRGTTDRLRSGDLDRRRTGRHFLGLSL